MTIPPSPPPASHRVTEAFAGFAQSTAAKEGIAPPTFSYQAAASASLPDGAIATLWVGTAEGVRSRCYHVDVIGPDGQSAAGFGACAAPGNHISLGRAGSLVIGSVGTHTAASVRVVTEHGEAVVPVTEGYFMVPPHLTSNHRVLHAVHMIGPAGEHLGAVSDLIAPGSGQPITA
ncbi:hypothetical protein [Actinospica robiniae]|uniref:hypothetical protein n=1 Tax=Actinospica robiniae TaxID=304901 RepID=UPI00040F80C1|nr:hypothetical protein [Actinospica robiniae]